MAKVQLPKNVFEQMRRNRWRTLLLFLIFPAAILGLTYLGIIIGLAFSNIQNINIFAEANIITQTYGFWIIVFTAVYSIINYFFGSKLILGYAGAKPIEKRDNIELYRIIENISIAAGMPKTPEIYIIEDESLNAFATGTHPKNAKVAVTRGLLNKLDKNELEGVIGHEIGHVINRDIRVMLLSITLLGSIEMLGEILIRTRGGDDKKGNILPIIGILLLTVGVLMGFLAKMAISRQREFLADSTGAYLTHNPRGLANALRKISQDSRVEILDKKASVAGLCIADPTKPAKSMKLNKKQQPNFLSKLWSSHPPIEDRISILEQL